MKTKIFLSILCGMLFGFNSPATAADLDIPGTGDGVAVLNALSQVYFEKTGHTVSIPHSIGSGGGVAAAGGGKAVMSRVARGIKEKEKHFGLDYLPIFDVPTVFFVNPNVNIDNLTDRNILDIFSGKISNWKQVGGRDVAIKLYVREDKDSSYNNLKKTFPGFDTIDFSPNAIVAIKTPYMVNFIKHEEDSIGFGPYDVAIENGLKVMRVNGIHPADKKYPYHGTIGLVFKKESLNEEAKAFIAFLKTDAARKAIMEAGGTPR